MKLSEVAPVRLSDRWANSIPAPKQKNPSMRVFGVVMLLGFGFIGGLALWSGLERSSWRVPVGIALLMVGVALFIIALIAPRSLQPIYHAWMRFGESLGTVVSMLLLSILYFLVVTPVGWIMRATGTDPIERSISPQSRSYWRPHPSTPKPEDYRHMS